MSKKSNIGLIIGVAAVAAVAGGAVVCYLNREKIKESETYKKLGVDEKISKVKNTIKEHLPSKEEEDIFDEDEFFADIDDTDDEEFGSREYVSLHPQEEEAEAATEKAAEETEESPIAYENEGLSDSSEDVDTLKEQDQLEG